MNSLFSPNYSSAKFPEPREFQSVAHDKLRQGFKEGHRCQLIMSPTGSGKTYLGMRIIHEALQRGKRAMFVCDRTTLINQTSHVADSYGLAAHSIIQSGHWRFDSSSRFQIASVQTLARRSWPSADVIVIDECFPAGTKISTKDGEKNIEDLNSGDLVYNSCGESYIISVFSKLTYATINVRLSDGSNIECTAEHPIFTDTGWRPASALARGSRVYRKEDLQSLWEAFQPENIVDRETCRTSCSGISFQQASMLRKILREEIEESNALPRSKAKSFKKIKKNRAQAKSENGEWRWNDEAASHNEASSWCGMDSRICGKDTKKPYRWLSASLQDRFSESCLEDCYRAGRSESLFDEKKGAGQKEGLSSSQPWVESIEIIEYPSGISVYNLRVAGHPSYFANGILVHNCHTQYKAWTEHIQNTDAVVFGLSATPFSQGLGRLFSNLINAATMSELTQSGVLVPMRVFSCTKINMAGAETSGGEWKESAAAKRGMEIIGDVVTEWQKFAENRKTIVFGATIEHCQEMSRQFNEAGIMAATFTSDTTESERKELLDEFNKPDSFYRILISVEALAKGFDCIAEGSLILTHRGLVPIEKLLYNDMLWDGHEFVNHGGIVYKGEQNVITYSGLTATQDHLVKTDKGWVCFAECARLGIPIVRTGNDEYCIREDEGCFSGYYHKENIKGGFFKRELPMFKMRISNNIKNKIIAFWGGVQKMLYEKRFSILACFTCHVNDGKMRKQNSQSIQELWWPRDKIQFQFSAGMRGLDYEKYATNCQRQEYSDRQDKQQWTLRTRKSSLGNKIIKLLKYSSWWLGGKNSQIQNKLSRNKIFRQNIQKSILNGIYSRNDNRKIQQEIRQTKRRVWDILNAGPRNSFTCEGLLVHNCSDVGCVADCRPLRKSLSTAIQMWGRGLRSSPETGKEDCILLDFSGNIIRFADDYAEVFFNGLDALDMGEKLDKVIRRDDQEKEPSKCPSCGYTPCGKRCVSCGFERQPSSLVEHLPGEMQEIMIGKAKLADDKKHLYEQVCTYTRSFGNPETARQRAWYLFQDLAGCRPSQFWKFEDQPNTEITKNTLNHIKRKQIAFAKGKQKARATA